MLFRSGLGMLKASPPGGPQLGDMESLKSNSWPSLLRRELFIAQETYEGVRGGAEATTTSPAVSMETRGVESGAKTRPSSVQTSCMKG